MGDWKIQVEGEEARCEALTVPRVVQRAADGEAGWDEKGKADETMKKGELKVKLSTLAADVSHI